MRAKPSANVIAQRGNDKANALKKIDVATPSFLTDEEKQKLYCNWTSHAKGCRLASKGDEWRALALERLRDNTATLSALIIILKEVKKRTNRESNYEILYGLIGVIDAVFRVSRTIKKSLGQRRKDRHRAAKLARQLTECMKDVEIDRGLMGYLPSEFMTAVELEHLVRHLAENSASTSFDDAQAWRRISDEFKTYSSLARQHGSEGSELTLGYRDWSDRDAIEFISSKTELRLSSLLKSFADDLEREAAWLDDDRLISFMPKPDEPNALRSTVIRKLARALDAFYPPVCPQSGSEIVEGRERARSEPFHEAIAIIVSVAFENSLTEARKAVPNALRPPKPRPRRN